MPEMGVSKVVTVLVMTTTQRDALAAVEGMIIFNSTTDQLEEYDGSTWQAVGQVIMDTHIADLDAHKYSLGEILRTGEYFIPFPIQTASTRTLTADRMHAHPFVVNRALTIDRLAIEVTTEKAGAIARLGVYADGTNLYPGALEKDYGTVSVAATGVVAASADLSLTKGLYWLVIVSDSNPTVRSWYPSDTPLGFAATDFSIGGIHFGWYKNAVGSGALDDPFVSDGSLFPGHAPLVAPRLKSLD